MITGKKSVLVITHDGWKFHTDEIFACAMLILYYERIGVNVRILRTRDSGRFPFADHLVDVGGKNDQNNFDHHGDIGGKRPDGTPYAATGLVWEQVGRALCSNIAVFSEVDKEFVRYLDASDNGFRYNTRRRAVFFFIELVSARRNRRYSREETDHAFAELVSLAIKVLRGKIAYFERRFGVDQKQSLPTNGKHEKHSFSMANEYEEDLLDHSNEVNERKKQLEELGKRIENAPTIDLLQFVDFKKLIRCVDTPMMLREVMSRKSGVLFIIYPANKKRSRWIVRTVENNFPESWRRARGTKLHEITGTCDILSCQKGGRIVTTRSVNAAKTVAKKAILAVRKLPFAQEEKAIA